MMAREGWPTPYDRTSVLEAIGKQRTSEARGETIRKDPSFLEGKPKNLPLETIAPRPVLFIVGTEAATAFMSKAGYEQARQPKEWFEVPGATNHRMYDDEAAVGKAVARLEEFFGRSL